MANKNNDDNNVSTDDICYNNPDIDSTVPSTSLGVDVNHTSIISGENAIAILMENIHDNQEEESVADFNQLIFPTSLINPMPISENLTETNIGDLDNIGPTNVNSKSDINNDFCSSVLSYLETSVASKITDLNVQSKNQMDNQPHRNIDLEANNSAGDANLVMTTWNASSLEATENQNADAAKSTPALAKPTKTSKARNKHFPQFINLYCSKCGESPWNSKYYQNAKCPACENKAWLRCCKCKQESDRYESMVYHLKTKCAPNNVKYKCSQCDYDTFLRSSFKCHLKTHEPPNNVSCSDCGVSVFKTDKSLRDHKRYYCPNRKIERNLKCASCCKGYKNEKHLQRHEKKCFYAQVHKKTQNDAA